MIFDIEGAEEKIGYKFKDKMLLRKCFTHSSYSNENRDAENNEVLEFFGDAILDFVVTEYLFSNCKGDEGALTKLRSSLVSKEPLERAIFGMGLDGYMLLGKGLVKNSGMHEKLYSSLFEAIVAGMYLDGGIAPVKKFILEKLVARDGKFKVGEEKKKAAPRSREKDGKSECQEYVQKNKLGEISYKTLEKSGPEHAPRYIAAFLLDGREIARGEGGSKKQAETDAAKSALLSLKRKKKAGKNQ
ncbi:MAG: ribonuclease III [Bacillota bacterium]|nr:MAG: ribonuclease III [Bacillota bacterium]